MIVNFQSTRQRYKKRKKPLLNLVRTEPLTKERRLDVIVTSLFSEANADPNNQRQGAFQTALGFEGVWFKFLLLMGILFVFCYSYKF